MSYGVPIPEHISQHEHNMARGQEIEDRYSKDIPIWTIEHGTDRQDFTKAQRWRFNLWEATGCSVNDAAWLARMQFSRFLIRNALIGADDDVRAPR